MSPVLSYGHTIINLFENQASKNPSNLAIKDKTSTYTYKELNNKANQIAHYLSNQITEGDFVALLLEPSAEYILCLIAILKLGGIYVSLDTHAPRHRLSDLLKETQPKIIITKELLKDPFLEINAPKHPLSQILTQSLTHSEENNPVTREPSAACCMIYTSGSTGTPKGVLIPHQAIVNMAWVENSMSIGEKDLMAQLSNITFDGSTFEIWTTLLNGATLCIIPPDSRFNPSKLKKWLLNYGASFLFLPTSYLHQIIQSTPDVLNSIKTILFGGEQINLTLINQLVKYRHTLKKPLKLINGYGPTETTAYVCRQIINTEYQYDPSYLESIGQLIHNTKAYILDNNLMPTTEGELYISGASLAIGYHHCEEQNNTKFIPNPFCNEQPYDRLYKTGDKVRKLDSGDLLYLGRLDDQVKIGGFRVHLNEIETFLMHHPNIIMAAAQVQLSGSSHNTLTAYLVFADNKIIHAEELREFLKQKLPSYMIPAKWYQVEKLPLTSVGKVDKKRLETIPHIDLELHQDSSSESPTEEQIKIIWQELLHLKKIDPNKNLFDLGANSLLLSDACSRINKMLHTELQVGELISHPTIHKLSRYIEGDIDLITTKKRRKVYTSDIAIIGMSCCFPGANSIEEFWENICAGKESLSYFDKNSISSHSNYIPVRGILSDIEWFDASFFGYTAIEASLSDPQQRLLLQCAWHALEHAGIAPKKAQDSVISVFAGMNDSSYLQENILKNKRITEDYDLLHQRIASSASMLSTQISYRLNLKGRSVNINTACSTGLLVVDQACQDLIMGYSDIALAGATSISVPQNKGYHYQEGSIVSADGHCRPFAEDANGTVFSNGVGMVVLKRLKEAIKDKDIIYAVIKGRGINNDGAEKLGFTAPSIQGQEECIKSAIEEANISAEEIGYVEAHGTATKLGDLIEFNALNTVYKTYTSNKQFCLLGSVKANIGHTDTVAGIAGLMKAALCLYYHKIPPLIHYEHPNPHLNIKESAFVINKTLTNWESGLKRRYAAVSSFGVGGTNAHMILAEQDIHWTNRENASRQELLILSAKTKESLAEKIEQLISTLSSKDTHDVNFQSLAYTLQVGREDFSWKTFAIGSNKNELIHSLKQNNFVFTEENVHESIIFMFPGQGSQYPKMAMELYHELPQFAQYINQGVAIAQKYLDVNLLEIINQSEQSNLNRTEFAQASLFIIEYALAQLLIEFGIKPHALVGHSLGEYVAACVAGVFTFEEGVKLICQRGILMSKAQEGAMITLECSEEEILDIQSRFEVELALHNAPSLYVLSGNNLNINQLESYLSNTQKIFQKIPVSHAFHSQSMESLKEPFLKLFDFISFKPPTINIISNVTGDWIAPEEIMSTEYWYKHLRHTVHFSKGLNTLLKDSHPFFIEVGLGHSLSYFLNKLVSSSSLKKKIHSTSLLPNKNKKTTDLEQWLTALGAAWSQDLFIKWELLYQDKPQKMVLPLYPYQKNKYWIEPDIHQSTNNTPLYIPSWNKKSLVKDYLISKDEVMDHSWIIFKNNEPISIEIISLLKQNNASLFIIELGNEYKEINPNHVQIKIDNKNHYLQWLKQIKKQIKNPLLIHLWSLNGDRATSMLSQDLDRGFYSLLYFTQAFIEVFSTKISITGLMLTQGTQKLTGAEEIIPANGCISGACLVINKEYPSFQLHTLDIENNAPIFKNTSAYLINYLLKPFNTSVTSKALRHNILWELNYQNINFIPKVNPFKNNGVYLITGGLGGIGLTLSQLITHQVQSPHLILLSRAPCISENEWSSIIKNEEHPDHLKIKSLWELKEAGASIYWHQLDLKDKNKLEDLVKYYQKKLGGFNGLIHAAGIAGNGIISLKTHEQVHQVLEPKLMGTYHLANAFEGIHLDFVVLMSSLAALVGEVGQIDYAAANAALNTFAQTELFDANLIISINWNTWSEVGMSISTSPNPNINFLNRGNDITPEQGKTLFLKILQSGYSQVIVSNYELKYHDIVVDHHLKHTAALSTKTSREKLNITSPYTPPQTKMNKKLAYIWQNILGLDTIGVDDDFFAVGGHSLNALQLIDKVNKELKSSLSVQQLYKHPTIKELSLLLQNETQSIDILVPLAKLKNKAPYLFICHPASGMIYCFDSISRHLSKSFSLFGIQDPSITKGAPAFNNLLDMAKEYLTAIKTVQPQGPYYLLGYSFGGTIMYEIAHFLKQESQSVALLGLIDSWSIFSEEHLNKERFINEFKKTNTELNDNLISLAWFRMQLLLNHKPTKTNQEMLLFKAEQLLEEYKDIDEPHNGWSYFNKGKIITHSIPANHNNILNPKNSIQIWNILNKKGYFKNEFKN